MKRNKFSLSHYKVLTMDMGKLIPITWYEALPGDTIQQATSLLIRTQPLLAPIMHPIGARIHHWFVPLRLIWEDFEDFITGGPDGTSIPVPPYMDLASVAEGSVWDYFGLPPATYSGNIDFSALPLRAYQMIYNEHYRDQDLCSERTISLASGDDSTTSQSIAKVAWEKDYFTTARPWEQKGDEVTIPISGNAPVYGIGKTNQTYGSSSGAIYETDASGTRTYADYDQAFTPAIEEDPSNAGYPNIRADLSAATGVSINELRLAVALQKYQEARARYGSRYVEYLRYLGITPSDGRLQNPEYLGGARQTIQISEVLQTAEGSGTPVGNLLGHGITALRSNRYRRFFPEHGIVMSLLSVVPKSIYANAISRGFLRKTKEDYWQRELQHIGDQEITNKEVYSEHASLDDVFGYQGRYDEYRHIASSIAGEFHSTLEHWHMARMFSSDPALNNTFVEATPTTRVYAAPSTDPLYVMANHSIQARRMVSGSAKGGLL